MATVNTVIRRAMRLIHVLDGDEEPSASEAQDCLEAFNDLIDSWSVDRAYIFALKEDSLTWPANQESRTIGATGDLVTTRPTSIKDSSFFTDASGNDYLFRIVHTRKAYSAIADKDVGSTLPQNLYYEPTFPDGTLYLWPVPSVAITVKLHSLSQLTQVSALTTTLSFPPGYKQAFTMSLAEEIAGEFGVAVPPEVSKAAYKARKKIKGMNRPRMIAQVEPSALTSPAAFNIFTDE